MASEYQYSTDRGARHLIPDDSRLPGLYATEGTADPIVWVKLFTPDSSWTWFLTEYDPSQRVAFGLVDGHEVELGYIHLDDLATARGHLGLPVERDVYFRPRPLSEVRAEIGR